MLNFPVYRQVMQQVALFGLLLMTTIAGGTVSAVSLNARFLLLIVTLVCTYVNWQAVRGAGTALDWGWLLLALATLLSTFRPEFRRSIELWLFPFGLQIPYFYAVVALIRQHWREKVWLRALLLVSAVLFAQTALIVIGYALSWARDLPPGVLFPAIDFRLSGVLDNANVFAAYLAVIIPVALGLFITARAIEKALSGLWLLGAVACLLATGSRGGLLAAALGSALALVLMQLSVRSRATSLLGWFRANRGRQVLLAVGVGVAAVGFLALIIAQSTPQTRQTAVARRLTLWQVALSAVAAQPLFGVGAGDFPLAMLQHTSVPPITIERHAHNILLHMLAESGLAGASALLLLTALIVRAGLNAWRTARPEGRLLLCGVIGGLVAFCAAGLVDDPLMQGAPFFAVTTLLAILAASEPNPVKRAKAWSVWPISASVAVSLAVLVLIVIYVPLDVGAQHVTAIRGDNPTWAESAQILDQGIALDPFDPLVRAQAAVAAARAAYTNPSPAAWQRAIERYQAASALDPANAVHHLNLAVLLWRAGLRDTALAEFAAASRQAPESAVIHLNYGIALEALGQTDAAQAEYRRALALNEFWQAALFWQATPTRQAALRSAPLSARSRLAFWASLQAGDAHRKAGQTDAARTDYRMALAQNETEQDLAEGLRAWAEGDLTQARYRMRLATAGDGDNTELTRAWLYLADLYAAQGSLDDWLHAEQVAFSRVDAYGAQGPGTLGEITYAVNAFGRFGYVTDYLPDVVLLDLGSFEAEAFTRLAQARLQMGSRADAIYIYRRILVSNPGYEPAQAGLRLLGVSPN